MVWWIALACTGDGADDESGMATDSVSIPIDDIAGWIATGEYQSWQSGELHPTLGNHFGNVLAHFSPSLVESLEAGNELHPVGAAAVKELYGYEGKEVLGHAVIVRTGEGTTSKDWYWYELYEGEIFADSHGDADCSLCHSGGVDFVISKP